tara:strand:+ start:181 stop:555 length:375 start_codon:yes stop_codon:yes gene_type:complete
MKQQIEIDFEGKKLGFHFGLGFLGELLDNLGFSIDELQVNIEKNPFKVIPKIMHTSYAYNLERKGEQVDLKLYDFIDLLDTVGGVTYEGVSSFLSAFTNSMTKDVPVSKNKIPTKGKSKANLKK